MVRARSSNLLGRITILVMVGLCVNTAMALDGSGTEGNPWRIQSLEDFNEFAADANYWDDYTRLETDVNLAGLTYITAVIAPDIDNSDNDFDGTAFIGVFDGNDKRIINLTIDDGGAGNDYLGVFGCIDGGEIKNLGIEGGSVVGNGSFNGGLAGRNSGGVSNCYSTGEVRGSGYSCVGGLVGENYYGNVSNCYSTGDVSGDYLDVGGLVGVNRYGYVSDCYSTGDVSGNHVVSALVGGNIGSVSNCYSTGDVNGVDSVGGLLGNNSGSVSYCYSTGDVNGSSYVGSLIGVNHSDFYGSGVSNCYSTGDVSGIHYFVGGLVGYNSSGSFSNCYSTGDVSGDFDVGGLVGYNRGGSVSNCYSIGDVNGTGDYVGGLVGGNYSGSFSNCFWDTNTQIHGVTESIGLNDGDVNNVEGLPTTQMQTKSTFTDANWDFIEIWNIGENQTYPYLRVYLAGDINKDRIVNFLDIAITANQWLQEQ
ncbi:MAG TPA: GLUG motif-containing protein [Sedimentisphaerales bacterium]|nr:GLUG motif-containing protein [Sedimentisphaerales bacterium]